jgi:hypothetical protein
MSWEATPISRVATRTRLECRAKSSPLRSPVVATSIGCQRTPRGSDRIRPAVTPRPGCPGQVAHAIARARS